MLCSTLGNKGKSHLSVQMLTLNKLKPVELYLNLSDPNLLLFLNVMAKTHIQVTQISQSTTDKIVTSLQTKQMKVLFERTLKMQTSSQCII